MPRFTTKTHTEEVSPDHVTYSLHTEGTVAPLNDEVIIENCGTEVLVSPVITVKQRFNWSTVEDLAHEITRHCRTDEEKALAIFTWVRTHGDHQYSGDIQALNPVVFFNVFGYGICAYFASVQTALARAAGLQARVWEIYRHTVGEIFYNGQWHMLDPDMQLFFLQKDNRTIASIEEIEQDLEFYSRTEAYQRTFEDAYGNVRHEHQSQHDTFRYDLKHPRYVQYDYDPYIYACKTMDYTLIPGETIVRAWKGTGKHNDYREQSRFKLNEEEPHKTWPPVHYGNGHVLYRANAGNRFHLDDVESRNLNITRRGLTVETPQDSGNGARSVYTYRRPLPYLIVGGSIRGEAFRDGDTAYDHISLVGSKKGWGPERKELYRQAAPGRHRFEIDLDEFLYPGKDHYAYEHGVQVILGAYAGNSPGSTTGLIDCEVKTEFQLQPRSLPALALGDNTVRVLHKTPTESGFKARITHTWTERHGVQVSKPPVLLAPSGEIPLTDEGITLTWRPPRGKVVSYRFQLSLHHQCAFPLSPNFDVDLKHDRPSFHVAREWFNPGTTYYWRVQARSIHGIWGPWSRIQSFTTGT